MITILVDNHSGKGLASEHGLAFWIEAGCRKILFDTGQGKALPINVEALGIDLSAADDIVLSHGHFDHAGALPYVLDRATRAVVHLHSMATRSRFSVRKGNVRAIGMQAESLAALAALPAARVDHVTAPGELASGIGLTGPVPRKTAFEDTGGPFYLDPDGLEPDPITDDLSLWFDTPEGLVVCLGCAHSGIVNILAHIRRVTGRERIDTIIGGLHLVQASEERLQETVAALHRIAPRRVVPCHCTGDAATEYLAEHLGEVVTPGCSGQRWDTESG